MGCEFYLVKYGEVLQTYKNIITFDASSIEHTQGAILTKEYCAEDCFTNIKPEKNEEQVESDA